MYACRGTCRGQTGACMQTYGNDLAEAYKWCTKYQDTRREADLHQAWDLYYHIFRRINKNLPTVHSLDLKNVSTILYNARDLQLAVPGTYVAGEPITTIQRFSQTLQVRGLASEMLHARPLLVAVWCVAPLRSALLSTRLGGGVAARLRLSCRTTAVVWGCCFVQRRVSQRVTRCACGSVYFCSSRSAQFQWPSKQVVFGTFSMPACASPALSVCITTPIVVLVSALAVFALVAMVRPYLQVIQSKQRPRKLTIIGSNGCEFQFLLKGHEDLRQDERVMQLFGLVNNLLAECRETAERDLSIARYAVIPLSPNSGLIGWVRNCDTMHALIREYRESRHIALNAEHRIMQSAAPNYDQMMVIQKVEVFEDALERTSGDDLHKVRSPPAPHPTGIGLSLGVLALREERHMKHCHSSVQRTGVAGCTPDAAVAGASCSAGTP